MKYKYNISKLTCANCAKKIEDALNKDDKLKASLNFANLKLIVETDLKNPLKYIQKIVKKVDSDVEVYEGDIKEEKVIFDIIRLIIGFIFGVIGLIFNNNVILIISYIILLYKVAIKAYNLLVKNKTLNENFLITISSIGAYLIGKSEEGLMVILLYEIGKILEAFSLNKSRRQISDLMNIKAEYANLKIGEKIEKVIPESVVVDDIIVVKQGEKIPLDGVIVKGNTKLNSFSLTGESTLKSVKEGDAVLSGSINEKNIIEIKVTSTYENSTVNKILELTLNATNNKAKTENTVSKWSKIYTPVVFVLSIIIILFGLIFDFGNINDYIYKALVFLVISCPCAIAISVPLSYFAGIGSASRKGVLVKGSNYLDNLKDINTIVFDKTGTLTTGSFESLELIMLSDKYKEEKIKEFLVSSEKLSNHPLAKSIVKIIKIKSKLKVNNFEEIKGMGISCEIENKRIMIGSAKFCNVLDDEYIYIKVDNEIVAKMKLLDKIKDEAKNVIHDLKIQGIKCIMLTGDSKDIAIKIGKSIKIDEVYYELLPQDKYNLLKKIIADNKNIAYVGDGINDAPSLALAPIGISMGKLGQESAIEASSVVIMNDDLDKITEAIKISKFTNNIIKQNLVFAIATKIIVLLLSLFNLSTMFAAVFADVGVTLLTIINSTRILKNK